MRYQPSGATVVKVIQLCTRRACPKHGGRARERRADELLAVTGDAKLGRLVVDPGPWPAERRRITRADHQHIAVPQPTGALVVFVDDPWWPGASVVDDKRRALVDACQNLAAGARVRPSKGWQPSTTEAEPTTGDTDDQGDDQPSPWSALRTGVPQMYLLAERLGLNPRPARGGFIHDPAEPGSPEQRKLDRELLPRRPGRRPHAHGSPARRVDGHSPDRQEPRP
jgi:hypothetical protein